MNFINIFWGNVKRCCGTTSSIVCTMLDNCSLALGAAGGGASEAAAAELDLPLTWLLHRAVVEEHPEAVQRLVRVGAPLTWHALSDAVENVVCMELYDMLVACCPACSQWERGGVHR